MYYFGSRISDRSPYRLRRLACFISICKDLGLKSFSYKFFNDHYLYLRAGSEDNAVIEKLEDRFKAEYKSFVLSDEAKLYYSQLFEKFKDGVAV